MTFKMLESRLSEGLFWQAVNKFKSEQVKPHESSILTINPHQTYQTHIGFGGAFTESAAYTWSKLSKDKQQDIINLYFSQSGLAYTMGRTHINSCDFSLENYDYVKPFDSELKSFDISREEAYVIPMIKEAMKHVPNIKLLASPWSPPYWMKTNQNMNHGGKLLPEYKQVWANYYVKYLDEMLKRGIPYWAISVQNEPAAVQTWDSCIYSAEEERDFIKEALGPTIKAYNKDIRILGWDHNRDIIVQRAKTLLEDEVSASYTWGIANHWYVSEDFKQLSIVKEMFPDTHLIFTEGCIEGGPKPGAWLTGLRYARNMIGDLSNHVEGWIEWNLTLDLQGGPNHVGNFCDAPILIDTNHNRYIINSSYYAIGHFSKFIHEGAKRIHVEGDYPKGVSMVAYQNKDQSIVMVLLNESDELKKVNIAIEHEIMAVELHPHSLLTLFE